MARESKIPVVRVELGRNSKVIIRLPYGLKLIKKVKAISVRRWNPKGKYWDVPYDEDLVATSSFCKKHHC